MRIHDWASLPPLLYRGFHIGWLSRLAQALNANVLPAGHYATVWSDLFAKGEARSDWQQNHVVVWSPQHCIIAAVALLMPDPDGNRSTDTTFAAKAVRDIRLGLGLVVVDLFPPSPQHPCGVHAAIWSELTGYGFTPPPDKPLVVVSYSAGEQPAAYVEPLAVGGQLTDMPLFLAPEVYAPTPLASSYETSWSEFPAVWRSRMGDT